jgi:hypothetical protein
MTSDSESETESNSAKTPTKKKLNTCVFTWENGKNNIHG